MKVHTESVQFKADQKLLDFVEKKLSKLELFFDRVIIAEVKLKLENSGQIRDKVAEVRLEVPGQSLFVEETNKTFEAAIDNAVDDMRRQLTRYKEKAREQSL